MATLHHCQDDPFELAIFDCDGVLVDSELIASKVLARELTAIGYRLSPDECLRRFTGISLPSIFRIVEKDWGKPLPSDFGERLRRADVAAFTAELIEVAGARELLSQLSVRKCVASSGSIEKIHSNLAHVGLLGFLAPYLFSASMVDRGKPAPDLFLFAAGRMGVSPARCVVIEDSEAGVEAGKAAGMVVVGFDGASHCLERHGDRLRARGADAVLSRLNQLQALLDFLVTSGRKTTDGPNEKDLG